MINFARLTGDIHVLSAVDLKLLALAHTLEVAAYGSSHLRERPVQVWRVQEGRRGRIKAKGPEEGRCVTQGRAAGKVAGPLQMRKRDWLPHL